MRKDPNEFRQRFQRWKKGEKVYDAGRPSTPEVVVTPDYEYNLFLNTLPDNQRLTPEENYTTHRYWELNNKPRNFNEAKDLGMYTYDTSDKSYHGNSIAYDSNGTGYFMKPDKHDTVKYELDYYRNGTITEEGGIQRRPNKQEKQDWLNFRKEYELVPDNDRPGFHKYERKVLPKYDEGKEPDVTEELVNAGIGFVPIVGTLNEARQFIQEPSWEQAGWTALSAAGEFFPLLKGFKAAKNAAKATEATLNIARAAHKANKVAYYNRKTKNLLLIGTRRGKAIRDTMDHMFRSKEKLDDAKSAYNVARNEYMKWKIGQYSLKGADDLVLPIVSNIK